MVKSIHDMSIAELRMSIELKEKEYKEAIKTRKLFWEVKRITEEKRKIERQLVLKNIRVSK